MQTLENLRVFSAFSLRNIGIAYIPIFFFENSIKDTLKFIWTDKISQEQMSFCSVSWNNSAVISIKCLKLTWYQLHKTFPLSSGSSPGQDVRLTQLVWTTSCKNWASTTPGLRFPSGCREAWWTRWTKCCQCSSRSWARHCRTRRTRKAETKRSTEEHSHHCN